MYGEDSDLMFLFGFGLFKFGRQPCKEANMAALGIVGSNQTPLGVRVPFQIIQAGLTLIMSLVYGGTYDIHSVLQRMGTRS